MFKIASAQCIIVNSSISLFLNSSICFEVYVKKKLLLLVIKIKNAILIHFQPKTQSKGNLTNLQAIKKEPNNIDNQINRQH